jgi:hypothetical protein
VFFLFGFCSCLRDAPAIRIASGVTSLTSCHVGNNQHRNARTAHVLAGVAEKLRNALRRPKWFVFQQIDYPQPITPAGRVSGQKNFQNIPIQELAPDPNHGWLARLRWKWVVWQWFGTVTSIVNWIQRGLDYPPIFAPL